MRKAKRRKDAVSLAAWPERWRRSFVSIGYLAKRVVFYGGDIGRTDSFSSLEW